MSAAFFALKLLEKCFVWLLSAWDWKFTLTNVDDLFISFQFSLILFRFIMPITWYDIPFIRLYFASGRPFVVTNIFSGSFSMELEKSKPPSLNLATYFLYFYLFNLIVFDFYFDCISFCFLFKTLLSTHWNEIDHFHFSFFFLPICVSCKLCTFLSIVSIFFRWFSLISSNAFFCCKAFLLGRRCYFRFVLFCHRKVTDRTIYWSKLINFSYKFWINQGASIIKKVRLL